MADPSTVTPVAPAGIELWDGHSFRIGFGKDPDIDLWILEGTPPGLEGGEPIPQENMHSTLWRVKFARALIDMEECALVCHYDPVAYTRCQAIINDDSGSSASWTCQFPDGSTLDVWGYLRSFKPQSLVEGQKPTANVVLVATNWDPVNRVEAGPVLTPVAGT